MTDYKTFDDVEVKVKKEVNVFADQFVELGENDCDLAGPLVMYQGKGRRCTLDKMYCYKSAYTNPEVWSKCPARKVR